LKKSEYIVLGVLLASVVGVLLPGFLPDSERVNAPVRVAYVYSECLPEDLETMQVVSRRKERFIKVLLPLVLKSNAEVRFQRETLERIDARAWWLTKKEKQTLMALARTYRVEEEGYRGMLAELLLRVDTLPVSLVIAQAAIESGWGSSRFARYGNNLFGLRTPEGEGMVPQAQAPGRVFRVSVFKDLQSNIDYYLWTINTHPAYAALRELRGSTGRPTDALVLAQALSSYSESGPAYVKRLRRIIRYNDLTAYDDCVLELPGPAPALSDAVF